MKKIILFIFSLSLFNANVIAQKDSTFLKAEFVYGIDELDQIISFMQVFPLGSGDFSSPVDKAIVPVKLIISPNGLIESVTINGFISIEYNWSRRDLSDDYFKQYFSKQTQALCKFSEGLWIPSEINGKSCYDTIFHDFIFKWKDQKIYNFRYNFERESADLNFLYTPKHTESNPLTENHFLMLYGPPSQSNYHTESAGVMYYNFALEKLKEKKYFIAERMFKLSNLRNPTNDCLYNLAITQLNLKWIDDACSNLNKLAKNNDQEAISLMQQYCKEGYK